MRIYLLFILTILIAISLQNSKAQNFSSEQQLQIDSLNDVINNKASHDTTLASAYLKLTDIFTDTNYETFFSFCIKAKEISENGLRNNPSPSVELSFKKTLAVVFNNLANYYGNQGNTVLAIEYFDKCLKLFEEIGDINGMAMPYNNIGFIYYNLGEVSLALDYFGKSLKIMEEVDNKQGMAYGYNNIAAIYNSQGNVPNALEYMLKCLKIREEIGDKQGMAYSYNNIGAVQRKQGDIPLALEYYNKGLKIREEINDKRGMAYSYDNIGLIYKIDNPSLALEYFYKSLKIREEIGDKNGIAASFNFIGTSYKMKNDLPLALEFLQKSIKIREEIVDKQGLANAVADIGGVYLRQGNYAKAKKMGDKGLQLAQELGFPELIMRNAELLNKVYEKEKNYKLALDMRNLEIQMRDSITSEENIKATVQQQAKFEYEKQAAADSIKSAEAKKLTDARILAQEEQIAREKTQRFALYGGLALLLIFGGVMFNRFKVTQRQKNIIEEQKSEVEIQRDFAKREHQEAENQRHIVEEKNKEILDSINYAKRIQTAILPPPRVVKSFLDESFILYLPKDIVAGDFYWMEPIEVSNFPPKTDTDYPTPVITSDEGAKQSKQSIRKILFAAADCTGHGVPGAMVSVICNNGLNRSVREYAITTPGEILDKTREIVIEEFQKSEEDVKDGMDIALCCLEITPKGFQLQYAGANNPLWIVRKNSQEIEEIKANKQPIGKYADHSPFTTHTLQLEKGDSIYIFTDGFQDQFGGEKGKKFKPANLRKLILSAQNLPMPKQRDILLKAFDAWKGNLEQVDDVCVIGVRI